MPTNVPVPDKASGDIFTEAMWDDYIKDNLNKLLSRGHRSLTVAQFAALAADVEDGDEVYLEVDGTNGVLWHLIYESAEATYKWRCIGGPPLTSQVATGETTASTTYAALATAGPSVALPRAGDYVVEHGSTITRTGSDTDALGLHSYDIGGSAASDLDAVYFTYAQHDTSPHAMWGTVYRRKRKTALTAVTLTSKYRSNVGTCTAQFLERAMHVTPVRIRHDA